jgi:hypothetical protein
MWCLIQEKFSKFSKEPLACIILTVGDDVLWLCELRCVFQCQGGNCVDLCDAFVSTVSFRWCKQRRASVSHFVLETKAAKTSEMFSESHYPMNVWADYFLHIQHSILLAAIVTLCPKCTGLLDNGRQSQMLTRCLLSACYFYKVNWQEHFAHRTLYWRMSVL